MTKKTLVELRNVTPVENEDFKRITLSVFQSHFPMIDNAANLNCAKRDAESRALLGEQSHSSLPSKHAKIRKSVGSVAEARPSGSRCLSEKFPTGLAHSSLDYHPPLSSSSTFNSVVCYCLSHRELRLCFVC